MRVLRVLRVVRVVRVLPVVRVVPGGAGAAGSASPGRVLLRALARRSGWPGRGRDSLRLSGTSYGDLADVQGAWPGGPGPGDHRGLGGWRPR
ncbi:hypothetical protein [Flindersiella endophytica]